MAGVIEGLEPAAVWRYFAEISRIPRCSKHEKQVADYVLQQAQALGLEAKQDRYGNVVVRKPASPGRETAPSVCLQGHLDMVCEKNEDKVHDFAKDPIELVREGNVLRADGTTLGADNGIAVATNLAIMEDRSLEHGPLELLFTVDEETGLTGASHLRPGFVESRILLNLDSEEEGALYVGCAGGRNTMGAWNAEWQRAPAAAVPMRLGVRGLKGGHSGLEIHKGRGNSIKILSRVLLALDETGARVSRIAGGNKSNAIPREADALLYVPRDRVQKARAVVRRYRETVRGELATVEPDLEIALAAAAREKNARVLSRAQQKLVCRTLAALPHGVIKMSADIAGLVETSTNLAMVRTEDSRIVVTTSQRSSVASELDEIVQVVAIIFELGGAKVTQESGYPGWKPNLESPILKVARSTYRELFGKEPEVKAVHAGLECGIIGERYPGMDMVSFGPTLEGVHSPDEKIYIDTVERFWRYLLAILKNLS